MTISKANTHKLYLLLRQNMCINVVYITPPHVLLLLLLPHFFFCLSSPPTPPPPSTRSMSHLIQKVRCCID